MLPPIATLCLLAPLRVVAPSAEALSAEVRLVLVDETFERTHPLAVRGEVPAIASRAGRLALRVSVANGH